VNMTLKRLAAVATVSALGALAPAATAGAQTTTTTTTTGTTTSPLLTFVPPKVGQIVVVIGPVIINGKMISPGVNVTSPSISIPTFTLPVWPQP
jgi:hypothetical protein